MRTIFDAGDAVYTPWPGLLFPLAVALVALWLFHRNRSGWGWKAAVGVTLLILIAGIALPWADHRHVHAQIGTDAVKTAEGVVSGHRRWSERRFAGSSRGVGVTSTHRYTTVTYEYFFIDGQPFSFIVNRYPSQASFTNSGDPPVVIADGMKARADYFLDGWNDDEARILKLALGPGSPGGAVVGRADAVAMVADTLSRTARRPAGAGPLPPDFAADWARFAVAMRGNDAAAAKAMTRFPFQFGGNDLGADEFDSLWMSILAAPQRACLAHAMPTKEDGRFVVFCGPYGYYFGKGPQGWRLEEFNGDGEVT